jgi:acetaldehyde dehydrogenase (acetylating)
LKGLDPDLRALQEVRDTVARAKRACGEVRGLDQQQVDRLCESMARAGAAAALDLARLTVQETGIGRVHYKVLKNLHGSEGVWESIKDEKTVGIISRDERRGIIEVATPVGVIAGIIPTTNPACTAIYKALISVKARNAIVISPHPRARGCIFEAVEIMRRAIQRAGGPPDLVCCLSNPTIESTGALMKHRDVAMILATGGGGLVRAAYSSGKPAYGVGPGNVPCYVDRSADIEQVATDVVSSQSFDNATLCCSEQALVLDRPIAERTLAAFKARGAYLCDAEETAKLAAACNTDGHMNADVVGLDPWKIAQLAGFEVPRATSVLLAHQGGVGKDWPLSIEILCPLLSVHVVDGWEEGCRTCIDLLKFGGLGHTLAVHAREQEVLDAFFLQKPASRICANGPTSQGAVGFSTNLVPAMSLGCGPQAGNITSDNITAKHLVNLKRVALPKAGWRDVERRLHERVSAMTGAPAPRGSGMPGDPSLDLGARAQQAARVSKAPKRPAAGSNWQGNPTFVPSLDPTAGSSSAAIAAPAPAAPAATREPVVQPHSAPTFTRPAPSSRPRPAVVQSVPITPTLRPAAQVQGHELGAGLSPTEIEGILEHAGAGCPLGPCQGCPHLDVKTHACTA